VTNRCTAFTRNTDAIELVSNFATSAPRNALTRCAFRRVETWARMLMAKFSPAASVTYSVKARP
jgi:hypothetical protein